MALVNKAFVDQRPIDAAVQSAERSLRPDVEWIRYRLGEDWTGAPAVFFSVLLPDDAGRPPKLGQIAEKVTRALTDAVAPYELGLEAYFSFRSRSEQDTVEAWY